MCAEDATLAIHPVEFQGLDRATLAKLSLNFVLVPVVGEVLNVHL